MHGGILALAHLVLGYQKSFFQRLAQCYIRDADGFHNAIQILFGIVLVLMPFAMLELVTGRNLLRELFAANALSEH
jgi:hypothetical protein